jgi:DGQHR domain-containing protein
VVGAKILKISEYVDDQNPDLSIKLDQVASIIDGQHRLKGREEAHKDEFEVPVSIFIGADDATEAMLFSIVNLAQTKVNRSLVYDLFSVAQSRSPEKTCHEVVVALDRMEESPFQNRIKRLGVATDGRFGEALSQVTAVKGILP